MRRRRGSGSRVKWSTEEVFLIYPGESIDIKINSGYNPCIPAYSSYPFPDRNGRIDEAKHIYYHVSSELINQSLR